MMVKDGDAVGCIPLRVKMWDKETAPTCVEISRYRVHSIVYPDEAL